MKRITAALVVVLVGALGLVACHGPQHRQGLMATDAQIDALPTSGTNWDNMVDECGNGTIMPDSQTPPEANSWQDATADTNMLACAVLAVRLDEGVNNTLAATYRDRVRAGLDAYVADGPHTRKSLGTGRALPSMIEAADLIDYYTPNFMNTLRTQLVIAHDDGVCSNTNHGVSECSGENHGDHARAVMVTAARFLQVDNDNCGLLGSCTSVLQRQTAIFREYIGQTTAPVPGAELNYDDGDVWRPDGKDPRGINGRNWVMCPDNTGHLDVGGVRAGDQARGGSPLCGTNEAGQVNENYAYGGFQGVVKTWYHLIREGLIANNEGDVAIHRAAVWLHDINQHEPDPDDAWQLYAVNHFMNLGAFGFHDHACDPDRPGKNGSCSVANYLW